MEFAQAPLYPFGAPTSYRSTMRTTEESEQREIQDAVRDRGRALAGMAAASDAARAAQSRPNDPLVEAHERQSVRVALALHRETAARVAHARGARRRSRGARLRAMLGLRASPSAPPPAVEPRPGATPDARIATLGFLDAQAPHAEHEDLHPTALDPPAAALELALATADLRQKNADRDARDA